MLAHELMNFSKGFFCRRRSLIQIVKELTTMIYYSIFIQSLLFSEAFSLYDWLHSTRFHKMIDPSDSTYAHEPMEILGNFMCFIL